MVVVLTQVADDFEFSFLFGFSWKYVISFLRSLHAYTEKAKINSKPDFIHTKKIKNITDFRVEIDHSQGIVPCNLHYPSRSYFSFIGFSFLFYYYYIPGFLFLHL